MEVIGVITEQLATLIGLDYSMIDDPHIYIGQSNEIHMNHEHPDTYFLYRELIYEIVEDPDYARLDNDGSIEYIKLFKRDDNGDYVKVAVRISNRGQYFARSLYIVKGDRVQRFIKKGLLHPLKTIDNNIF